MVNVNTLTISKCITFALLFVAFIISAVRHSFWLCLIVPLKSAYRVYKHKSRTAVISALVGTALVVFQPFFKLPSSGFIGSLDQMEAHTDIIFNKATSTTIDGQVYPTRFYYWRNIPVTEQSETQPAGGNVYDFWNAPQVAQTPVRPTGSTKEDKKMYLQAKGLVTASEGVLAKYNSDRMKDIFPFEPVLGEASNFTPLTNTLSGYIEERRLPWIKHFLVILVGYAGVIFLLSKAYTLWLTRITPR